MPTKREREYYRMGFTDGQKAAFIEVQERGPEAGIGPYPVALRESAFGGYGTERDPAIRAIRARKPKRKLSAWNKFVKANSKKPRFVLRSGKLNLKKMGVAFRKTPAGKKKRR